ncbi:MAG: ABC transporter permease [Spirochaetaceae bacterium]|nr:ABC transporter permease [Spirochaetaceae bacterium]
MITFIVRRVFIMIPTVVLISLVSFLVIDLPPGDLASSYVARLEASQEVFRDEARDMIAELRARYGLDDPFFVRYFKWASRFARGDWGFSLLWNKPVRLLIQERILITVSIAFLTLILSSAITWPAGVGAALRQYSLFDNIFSFTAFFMMAIPNFLFALILMYLAYEWFDYRPGGLFSPDMVDAPWSVAKFLDFLAHIWMPLVVLGFESIGGGLRTIRANVLDQLRMPYVTTARAKGVPETRLLVKYPIRMAANPWISTVGWILPGLVAGEVLVSIVIGLPTIGPLMLEGLRNQDMQLAGGILMLLATLTVIGTLISDLLLAVLDPRIRITE